MLKVGQKVVVEDTFCYYAGRPAEIAEISDFGDIRVLTLMIKTPGAEITFACRENHVRAIR